VNPLAAVVLPRVLEVAADAVGFVKSHDQLWGEPATAFGIALVVFFRDADRDSCGQVRFFLCCTRPPPSASARRPACAAPGTRPSGRSAASAWTS
jgi:hypothetical protein